MRNIHMKSFPTMISMSYDFAFFKSIIAQDKLNRRLATPL